MRTQHAAPNEMSSDGAQSVSAFRCMVAMLSERSGERASAAFLRTQLERRLGTDRVFILLPLSGQPPDLNAAKVFLVQSKPDIVLVVGGDGTVSLVMDLTDELRRRGAIASDGCPIAILPTGTGNDLSRCLGFGGGYVRPLRNAGRQLDRLLTKVLHAAPQKIDRFGVQRSLSACVTSTTQANSGDSDATIAEPVCMFTNYFSIGFDAAVATEFGTFREKYPQICTRRTVNKLWYGAIGFSKLLRPEPLSAHRSTLVIDGAACQVPAGTRAVVVSNVFTYAGGTVLWHDARQRYKPPSLSDKLVEVTALSGVGHMIGVGMAVRHATKLGQGSSIELRVPADCAMQCDGEPVRAMGRHDQYVTVRIAPLTQSLGMCLTPDNVDHDIVTNAIMSLDNPLGHDPSTSCLNGQ